MVPQNRAVFLDRDGVINEICRRDGNPYPPHAFEEFKIYPEAYQACQILKDAGYLLIVVTNQPDVGRGTLEKNTVSAMHDFMIKELPIQDVHVSFAASEADDPEKLRKPSPGMLLRAANKFSINLAQSYMVGDRWRDIDCGRAAGCRTIWVDRGYRESRERTMNFHFRVSNLLEAAQLILNQERLK